jgi:hypothetical protein
MDSLQNSINQLIQSALENSAGNFKHTGDLLINGTLTVDTVNVNNLITEHGNLANPGNWVTITEDELSGKGFSWTWGDGGTKLLYRDGNRLWTSGDFDLGSNKSYKINNVPVLSASELGPQVTKSKLRELGTLNSLTVSGDATISDFAVFNSTVNRLGLGTDQPNAILSILDNGIEIVTGAAGNNLACFGTFTNDSLEIITDNTTRVTFKNDGEVIFGNESTKTANVTVYGTLKVENLLTDNRLDRYSSLEFKASTGRTEYGLGLTWTGTGNSKNFLLMPDPSRLWSSESLELAEEKSFYINGSEVLSKNALGTNVTKSNLATLGTLESLSVQGEATFFGDVNASHNLLRAKNIVLDAYSNRLSITNLGVDSSESFSIKIDNDEALHADKHSISIGNKNNNRKPVKVFGPLSIGASNPDPDAMLSVNGDVILGGKKFTSGTSAPVTGNGTQGDICWNSNPQPNSYVGWICISSGAPGAWMPFGMIVNR